MDIARKVLREPEVSDAKAYGRHVRLVSWIYVVLFLSAVSGAVIVVHQGRFFVTLAQRSNVETLTLAFLVMFFAYVAVLSLRGLWGFILILRFRIETRLAGPAKAEEKRTRFLSDRMEKKKFEPAAVMLSRALELEERPHETFSVPIMDGLGRVGTLHFEGAKIEQRDVLGEGSYTLFPFVVTQIEEILKARGVQARIGIVEWFKIDDEAFDEYLGQVSFALNLSRQLKIPELWPTTRLNGSDVAELERRLLEICPSFREALHLPQWEYSGDHKLPIIPEPLGIVSLSRTEKRVDPLASMGATAVVSLIILAMTIWMIFYPPWVPSA